MQALRYVASLGLSLCALVFCSEESFAQRDLRVPGRTGVKTRPIESSEEKRGEAGQAGTARKAANRLTLFPQAASALGSDTDTLSREFENARSTYNKLRPEQFIAARFLAGYVRAMPGVEVTSEDLIRGLANKKKYRATLKAKGLTGEQVENLMRRLNEQMTVLLQ
jgi:hypothetical protein